MCKIVHESVFIIIARLFVKFKMKYLINKLLLVFFALSVATSLYAQGRHETNAFIGGYYSEFTRLGDTNFFYNEPNSSEFSNDLWDLYEPHYSITSGPVFTINYHFVFNKFFRFGGQLSYGFLSGHQWHKLGNKPAEHFNLSSLYLLPEVKACIPCTRHFRPYCKASVGIEYRSGSQPLNPWRFAWEVAPIGAEWGGQIVYGNAELCWGSIIKGGRIGVGFRF